MSSARRVFDRGSFLNKLQQLTFQVELTRFGSIDRYETCGTKLQELSANFGANAAGAAGDHDDMAIDQVADAVQIELHGFAGKKVLDRDGARLQGHALFEQFLVSGQDLDAELVLRCDFRQPPHLLAGELARHDEDFFDGVPFGEYGQVFTRAQDGNTADTASLHVGPVVDEAHHAVREKRVIAGAAQQRLARMPSPDDEAFRSTAWREQVPGVVPEQPRGGANGANGEQRGTPVDHDDAAGDCYIR